MLATGADVEAGMVGEERWRDCVDGVCTRSEGVREGLSRGWRESTRGASRAK